MKRKIGERKDCSRANSLLLVNPLVFDDNDRFVRQKNDVAREEPEIFRLRERNSFIGMNLLMM